MNLDNLSLLFRCNRKYSHSKLKSSDLGENEFMICTYICNYQSCSQDDVANGLALDKTTVAKAVKRLEEKGFLKREKDKGDARKYNLSITDVGRKNVNKIIAIHNRWFEEVGSVLSKDEQKLFEEYSLRLLKKAREITEINN